MKKKIAGRATPVGITTHLKDSNIQQLVSGKTKRVLSFSYQQVHFNGLEIGVIEIPVQDRPTFLTQDFGKLKKGEVYVRRNSATEIAKAAEILAMAQAPRTPKLELQFADIGKRTFLGIQLTLTSTIVEFEQDKIPVISFNPWSAASILGNPNYLKDKAKYVFDTELINPIGFGLFNSSSSLATNVRLEATIAKTPKLRVLMKSITLSRPLLRAFMAGLLLTFKAISM